MGASRFVTERESEEGERKWKEMNERLSEWRKWRFYKRAVSNGGKFVGGTIIRCAKAYLAR